MQYPEAQAPKCVYYPMASSSELLATCDSYRRNNLEFQNVCKLSLLYGQGVHIEYILLFDNL
jgi:hypothetical protein